MSISEINHNRVISVPFESQRLLGEAQGRNERVLEYLEVISGSRSRVTLEGEAISGIRYERWCSPQALGGDRFMQDLSGRLNGVSRRYSLGDTIVDFEKRAVGKKTLRESGIKVNIQKILDAHAEGIDVSNPYKGLLNIVVRPNIKDDRVEQLFYMDQVLAFLKRFSPVEQVSKERRKEMISDVFLNVWIGANGGIDDITRPHFSVRGNKFTHLSVLF